MKLPRIEDFDFTPLAWKEWLVQGDKSKDFFYGVKSKRRIYKLIEQENREGAFEGCDGIKNYVRNRRIRRLLNGYALLDLLDRFQVAVYLRYKMWRLLEDLVGEIGKELIKERNECTVIYVGERFPGFKGLDYIIANGKSRIGWKVGIQCKRYIGTRIPYYRKNEYSSFSRGTSASHLYDKGRELKKTYSDRRRILLVAFRAYQMDKRQENRFNKLKENWDCVTVLDDNTSYERPYTYRLSCEGLENLVKWC